MEIMVDQLQLLPRNAIVAGVQGLEMEISNVLIVDSHLVNPTLDLWCPFLLLVLLPPVLYQLKPHLKQVSLIPLNQLLLPLPVHQQYLMKQLRTGIVQLLKIQLKVDL